MICIYCGKEIKSRIAKNNTYPEPTWYIEFSSVCYSFKFDNGIHGYSFHKPAYIKGYIEKIKIN